MEYTKAILNPSPPPLRTPMDINSNFHIFTREALHEKCNLLPESGLLNDLRTCIVFLNAVAYILIS
jgi:hypothetical protein